MRSVEEVGDLEDARGSVHDDADVEEAAAGPQTLPVDGLFGRRAALAGQAHQRHRLRRTQHHVVPCVSDRDTAIVHR